MVAASRGTNAATAGASRSSISTTISTCSSASRARWPAASRSSSGVAGRWPAAYDVLWQRLNDRHGRQDGTRAMVQVILLGRAFGHDLRTAGDEAHGACDVGAVRYLLTAAELRRPAPATLEVGRPATTDRRRPWPATTGCWAGGGGAEPGHARARRARPDHPPELPHAEDAGDRRPVPAPGGGGGPGGPQPHPLSRRAAGGGDRGAERKAALRRVKEARLPRLKTLQAFDFGQAAVSAARLADLASGGYIARAEPVLLIGEAGTGKTHLASGLCVAACEQASSVRFTTATALVNELVEARAGNVLPRAGPLGADRVICIDELGYVPLAGLAPSSCSR